jgi:hypothetical protein
MAVRCAAEAALHLEKSCRMLAARQVFSLLCACPLLGCSDPTHESFLGVCHAHTHVYSPGVMEPWP